ncbi:MAG: hypothetical protein IJU16_00380 [Clostridia bacterium]|nr:hypothetical protein [Clostridia bacterium]
MKINRMLSTLLALVVLLTATFGVAAPTVGADDTITTIQVRQVLCSIVEDSPLPTSLAAIADCDGSGRVDTTDVRILLDVIVNGGELPTPNQKSGFRMSGIADMSDANGTRSYDMQAPYTDTYTFTGTNVTSMTLTYNDNAVASGSTSISASLTKGRVYTLTVKTRSRNMSFSIDTVAQNHRVTLPYDVGTPASTSGVSLYNATNYTLAAAPVNYQKRAGGTYIFCNNPEHITSTYINKAFMRNRDLTGDVFLAMEYLNEAGQTLYLGYQLKNEGSSDVYVTVTNIGYQTTGTWYGQQAWCDYYNTAFQLPDDFSPSSAKYTNYHSYTNYTPRIFQPVTYRIPAGKYIYVIGGTSSDAYNSTNVGSTANKAIARGDCATGNVKFSVYGGSVTGTMYAYTNSYYVTRNPAATGYVVDTSPYKSYSQYSGCNDHAGVIDNYMSWTFNDHVGNGMMPVSITNRYANSVPEKTTPYAAYDFQSHTTSRSYNWYTHISPQEQHAAAGTDMLDFHCTDRSGNPVTVDIEHADGGGYYPNFGNWMVEYQDHFTLVNQGNNTRTVYFNYKDFGSLAVMARDNDGNVLEAKLTTGRAEASTSYVYSLTVPAHSVKQVTIQYLLVGNSYGTVIHSASIE